MKKDCENRNIWTGGRNYCDSLEREYAQMGTEYVFLSQELGKQSDEQAEKPYCYVSKDNEYYMVCEKRPYTACTCRPGKEMDNKRKELIELLKKDIEEANTEISKVNNDIDVLKVKIKEGERHKTRFGNQYKRDLRHMKQGVGGIDKKDVDALVQQIIALDKEIKGYETSQAKEEKKKTPWNKKIEGFKGQINALDSGSIKYESKNIQWTWARDKIPE